MTSSPDPVRTLRLVHGALLAGCLLFTGVVAYVTSTDTMPTQTGLEPLQWAAASFAVLALGPALVLRSVFRSQLQKNPSPAAIVRVGLMPAAVLEGAMLLNLVAWMVTDSQWPNAVAALLPFLVSAALWVAGPGVPPRSDAPR